MFYDVASYSTVFTEIPLTQQNILWNSDPGVQSESEAGEDNILLPGKAQCHSA